MVDHQLDKLGPQGPAHMEILQGVLGSGENGFKKYREPKRPGSREQRKVN